jgi:hypothetical protein
MNIYGSAFEETKRRVNARIAELVLPSVNPDENKGLENSPRFPGIDAKTPLAG